MASGVIKKFTGGTLSFAKTFCIDPEQRTEEIMKDQALEQQERFDAAARDAGGGNEGNHAANGLLSCIESANDARWGTAAGNDPMT